MSIKQWIMRSVAFWISLAIGVMLLKAGYINNNHNLKMFGIAGLVASGIALFWAMRHNGKIPRT